MILAFGGLALAGGLLAGGLVPASIPPPSPSIGRAAGTTEPTLTTATPGLELTPSLPPLPTPTLAPTRTPAATVTPSAAAAASPTPISECAHPGGWVAYTVQQGDTLRSLALARDTTPQALIDANCLTGPALAPGSTLYLPPDPTQTPTYTATPACGPPAGWVVYYVVRGDTLFSLARRTGTTVAAVQRANCLNANYIYVGQALYLPAPQPTSTLAPSPAVPPTATASATPSITVAPSNTPTRSLTPSPTISSNQSSRR